MDLSVRESKKVKCSSLLEGPDDCTWGARGASSNAGPCTNAALTAPERGSRWAVCKTGLRCAAEYLWCNVFLDKDQLRLRVVLPELLLAQLVRLLKHDHGFLELALCAKAVRASDPRIDPALDELLSLVRASLGLFLVLVHDSLARLARTQHSKLEKGQNRFK